MLRSGFFPNKLCLTVNLQPSNRVVITGGNFVHLLPSLFSRLQQERKRFSVLSIDLGRRVSKALSVHQLSGCPSAVLVRAPAAPGEDWRGRGEGGREGQETTTARSLSLSPSSLSSSKRFSRGLLSPPVLQLAWAEDGEV